MAQQKQTTPGNLTKKTLRLPLVGNNQQRDTVTDSDQRFINYIFETTKNAVTDTKKFYLVKRPGTVFRNSPSTTVSPDEEDLIYLSDNYVFGVIASELEAVSITTDEYPNPSYPYGCVNNYFDAPGFTTEDFPIREWSLGACELSTPYISPNLDGGWIELKEYQAESSFSRGRLRTEADASIPNITGDFTLLIKHNSRGHIWAASSSDMIMVTSSENDVFNVLNNNGEWAFGKSGATAYGFSFIYKTSSGSQRGISYVIPAYDDSADYIYRVSRISGVLYLYINNVLCATSVDTPDSSDLIFTSTICIGGNANATGLPNAYGSGAYAYVLFVRDGTPPDNVLAGIFPTGSTSTVGRGIWSFNNAVWSVVGDTLYREDEIKQVLLTDTEICGAVPFVNTQDFGKQGLFLCDGTDAWIIDSTDTVTRVDKRYLQWVTITDIQVGDRRVPTVQNGFWYTCTVAGLTGLTEPTWPTLVGDTVTDGTVTWECTDIYYGPPIYTGGSYTVGQEVIPTVESGYWYECIVAGATTAEPTLWPLVIGDTIVDGGVTWECKGQYGGFPSPHIPTPSYMDGYIFLPEPESVDIWNSDVVAPSSWGALNFVGAESYSDPVTALARQNNFIVTFGTISTEFMYNYAKSNEIVDFNSPLDRYESLVVNVGCLSKDCIMQTEKILMFVGTSSTGGKSVWKLDGGNAKEISTEYVEKFLDLESPTSGVTGFCMRLVGHIIYVLNLPTANRTFIYDLEEGMWAEWLYNSSMLPFMYFCDHNGDRLVQHGTTGAIYKFDPLTYSDFDSDITALVTLSKQDLDSDKYKFYHKLVLIGDTPEGTDVVRWSDDDYQTWSNDHNLQPANRPYIMRTGKARRRAWEFEYIHNSPRRLEAAEILYSIAEY